MNIIVCVKQVPDPETPPASFRIDPDAKRALPAPGVPPVLSPFCLNAVEAALKLKDAHGGKITVLSLGSGLVPEVVKKPLAMGADELVLLEDAAFEGGDSYATALALSAAIRKLGACDLVLCGRQASDWDAGQVGLGIAHFLGLPAVTIARKVEARDGRLRVERVVEDGYEVVETALPALVTVSNEVGEPRYPTLLGIRAAARKPVQSWKAADLGLGTEQVGEAGSRLQVRRLFIPQKESHCQFIEGEDALEKASKLAVALRTDKLI